MEEKKLECWLIATNLRFWWLGAELFFEFQAHLFSRLTLSFPAKFTLYYLDMLLGCKMLDNFAVSLLLLCLLWFNFNAVIILSGFSTRRDQNIGFRSYYTYICSFQMPLQSSCMINMLTVICFYLKKQVCFVWQISNVERSHTSKWSKKRQGFVSFRGTPHSQVLSTHTNIWVCSLFAILVLYSCEWVEEQLYLCAGDRVHSVFTRKVADVWGTISRVDSRANKVDTMGRNFHA